MITGIRDHLKFGSFIEGWVSVSLDSIIINEMGRYPILVIDSQ